MSKLRMSLLTAGSLALLASGAAMAAGPVGTPPPGGFSIDDVAFDANNVTATACPVGSTCITMTGSGGEMLQREVTDTGTGDRYIQTIIGDVNGTEEFANESRIFATSLQNSIAAKLRVDDDLGGLDPDNTFLMEHSFYRGVFDNSGNFPALENFQAIGGTFQTFNQEVPNIPNLAANIMEIGKVDIDQNIGGAAGNFAYRVLRGAGYAPNDFSVSVTDGNGASDDITIAGGAANSGLTATYIGALMPGGGPGADGLTAAERSFGVLIYRYYTGGQAAQTTQGGAPTEEIRATSQVSANNDSGEMYGQHGAFVNGDALSMGWDETLFGTAPTQ